MPHSNTSEVSPSDPTAEFERSDGFDSLGLFWRARRPIFFSLIVCGLLYAAIAACVFAFQPTLVVAEREISFTFVGAREGRYPNGDAFSPQDLLAAPVLQMVYDELHLVDFMKPADLAAGLTIMDGGGLAATLVQLEYTQRLQNTKLSEPERAKLVADFRSEMQRLSGAQFVLSADFRGTSLPSQMTERLLAAIPAAWARYALQTRGVAQYNLGIPKVTTYDPDGSLLDQWSTLCEEFEALEQDIVAMRGLPSAALLRDDRGNGIDELRRQLTVLRKTRLEPLQEPVFATDSAAAVERLRSNLEAAAARHTLAKSEQEVAEQIFTRYVTMGRGDGAGAGATGGADSRTGTVASGSMPATINLPENLITQLVEMRSLEADLVYRQKLNDDVINRSAETIKASRDLATQQEWLAKLEAIPSSAQMPPRDVGKKVSELKRQLADISTQAQYFLNALTQRNLNPSSVLYRLEGPGGLTVIRAYGVRQLLIAGGGVAAFAVALGLVFSLRPKQAKPVVAGRIADQHRAVAVLDARARSS